MVLLTVLNNVASFCACSFWLSQNTALNSLKLARSGFRHIGCDANKLKLKCSACNITLEITTSIDGLRYHRQELEPLCTICSVLIPERGDDKLVYPTDDLSDLAFSEAVRRLQDAVKQVDFTGILRDVAHKTTQRNVSAPVSINTAGGNISMPEVSTAQVTDENNKLCTDGVSEYSTRLLPNASNVNALSAGFSSQDQKKLDDRMDTPIIQRLLQLGYQRRHVELSILRESALRDKDEPDRGMESFVSDILKFEGEEALPKSQDIYMEEVNLRRLPHLISLTQIYVPLLRWCINEGKDASTQ